MAGSSVKSFCIAAESYQDAALRCTLLILKVFLQSFSQQVIQQEIHVFDFLLDKCPGFLQIMTRLLNSASSPIVAEVLDILIAAVCSRSSRRSEIIATLVHWRLSQSLVRFDFFHDGHLTKLTYTLYAVLDCYKAINVEQMDINHNVVQNGADPNSPSDYDGIWWMTIKGGDRLGVDHCGELICCKLRWTAKEGAQDGDEKDGDEERSENEIDADEEKNDDGTVGDEAADDTLIWTFEGTARNSDGEEAQISGQLVGGELDFFYGLDEDRVVHFQSGPFMVGGFGGHGSSTVSDEDGSERVSHGFFMWHDSLRSENGENGEDGESGENSENGENGGNDASLAAIIHSHAPRFPEWYDDDTYAQDAALLADIFMGVSASHDSSKFHPLTVADVDNARRSFPGFERLAEMFHPHVYGLKVNKSNAETDAFFESRKTTYVGSTIWAMSSRHQLIATNYLHELKEDFDIIKNALHLAYSSLPEDILVGAGVIVPSKPARGTREAALKALNDEFIAAIHGVCTEQRIQWATSKASCIEATAQLVDGVIRTGNQSPNSTSFDDSPIYRLYLKWTGRLFLAHPSLAPSEPPFTFEELVVCFSQSIQRASESDDNEEDELAEEPNMRSLTF